MKIGLPLALATAFLAGCAGAPLAREKAARSRVEDVGRAYRPDGRRPELPALTRDSPAEDYLRFALLRHPRVEAAFHAWRGAVEAIAPARSLPDPQIMLQADIGRALTSLVPGFMAGYTTAGKRKAMGEEAAASSEVARRAYVAALVDTAAEVRTAWIELSYLDRALAIRRQTAVLLDQSLAIAQADYAAGGGSLDAQTRLLDARAKLQMEGIPSLEDRRAAARVRFKSALGLRPGEADPPWPGRSLPDPGIPDEDALWRRVLAANPRLASLRATVEMAVASVQVARSGGTPDVSLTLMADVKADPVFFRPWPAVTLPLWRDKIAAAIASADANRRASEARLGAEELALATEFAEALFALREADRMAAHIDRHALPYLAQSEASAEAAYQSGQAGFSPLAESRLVRLDLELERASAERDRASALTTLWRLAARDADLVPPAA